VDTVDWHSVNIHSNFFLVNLLYPCSLEGESWMLVGGSGHQKQSCRIGKVKGRELDRGYLLTIQLFCQKAQSGKPWDLSPSEIPHPVTCFVGGKTQLWPQECQDVFSGSQPKQCGLEVSSSTGSSTRDSDRPDYHIGRNACGRPVLWCCSQVHSCSPSYHFETTKVLFLYNCWNDFGFL
jgi:hypothetical protein